MGSIMTESRRLVKGGMVSIVTSPWSIPLKVLRVGWDGFSTLTEMLLTKDSRKRAAVIFMRQAEWYHGRIPPLQSSGTVEVFLWFPLGCIVCAHLINEESCRRQRKER